MPAVRFASHALTHIGLVRRRNEDAFLDRPDVGLWAVADGMGGHEAGDYASTRIVTTLGEIAPPRDIEAFANACAERLRDVDAELRDRAAMLGPAATIASTVVVLIADEREFACLWAGDSRIYRWRGGELSRLTRDHSRVQELVDTGLLTPERAAPHPERNIVTRAIGGGRLEFGRLREPLEPGDRFLLCSDGLTNMVADAEIARELAPPASSDRAAQRLLDLVLARGAHDNVTAVVIDVEPVR
jgi:serine/threonine protein phosphatase PrpC